MSNLELTERAVWFAGLFSTGVLALKLWRERLLRVYPSFLTYLLWTILSGAVLYMIPRRTKQYAIFYFGFQGVFWLLYVLTALELVSVVLRQYPGIASFGRRAVSIALGISISIALVSMYWGANAAGSGAKGAAVINGLLLFEQLISFSVLVFLLITSGLLTWFPVFLPANATILLLGYTLCFAARAVTTMSINLWGFNLTMEISILRVGAVLACTLYWIFRVSAKGERSAIVVAPRREPATEKRLLEQLDSINSILIKPRRK